MNFMKLKASQVADAARLLIKEGYEPRDISCRYSVSPDLLERSSITDSSIYYAGLLESTYRLIDLEKPPRRYKIDWNRSFSVIGKKSYPTNHSFMFVEAAQDSYPPPIRPIGYDINLGRKLAKWIMGVVDKKDEYTIDKNKKTLWFNISYIRKPLTKATFLELHNLLRQYRFSNMALSVGLTFNSPDDILGSGLPPEIIYLDARFKKEATPTFILSWDESTNWELNLEGSELLKDKIRSIIR